MDTEDINKIRQQRLAGQWPKFLDSVSIDGLRGWNGQSIHFAFPVTAIVGENGTGKSTFLKASACAYENEVDKKRTYYPSSFFIDTHWDSISGVNLSYTVRQGSQVSSFKIKKPTKRWVFPEKRIKRQVFIFDIARTLPLDASVGYAKIAKLAASEISTDEITLDYRKFLSHILGRDYTKARFAISDVDANREVGLLTREFGEISQFHQGAGEDTTLDLMRSLQSIPDTSLLIIDEVEASLHPRAQRRLIRFLLWLSRQKRIQIILSTHSPYVLQELPQEARILLLPGTSGSNIVYGATPEFALSHLDENAHPELYVFVEDREAEIFLREILASSSESAELLTRLTIVPVGPSNVVQIMGNLAKNQKLPYKSIAVLDGDTKSNDGSCLNLPGNEAPERIVFNDLKDLAWPELTARFGIGAGNLYTYLEDAMLEPDHHKWTSMVGDRVIKSSTSVWETLVNQWCKSCLNNDVRQALLREIRDAIS
ncbi:ATP-dependent nuclease [Anabaenopsis elenkinii]|uniref:AAA family ATPase n=1 Tax=Anabaenopsis elenkinii CCIBt3563 TaxID=2779889 RepID=A0A7S6RCG7_9CYAN|nr:AAA family ATPase [Anabaenopsis elenkinii]QOV22416.1 AAA family ATPase [Anabaenopsis elenkinii CCIBt3563]